jgi:hypothetical protein
MTATTVFREEHMDPHILASVEVFVRCKWNIPFGSAETAVRNFLENNPDAKPLLEALLHPRSDLRE